MLKIESETLSYPTRVLLLRIRASQVIRQKMVSSSAQEERAAKRANLTCRHRPLPDLHLYAYAERNVFHSVMHELDHGTNLVTLGKVENYGVIEYAIDFIYGKTGRKEICSKTPYLQSKEGYGLVRVYVEVKESLEARFEEPVPDLVPDNVRISSSSIILEEGALDLSVVSAPNCVFVLSYRRLKPYNKFALAMHPCRLPDNPHKPNSADAEVKVVENDGRGDEEDKFQ